jgi:hypothetical protein
MQAKFDEGLKTFVEWFNGTFVPGAQESVRGATGPNILANCEFTAPVNQRGQTSYTDVYGGKYTIDRWFGDTPWGMVRANVTLLPATGIEVKSVALPDYPQSYGASSRK